MRISIVGCGWLGLPLAQTLIKAGYEVIGTKRSQEDADALGLHGITGICLNLDQPIPPSDAAQLFDADVLVLNIPSGRKSIDRDAYTTNMQRLINYAKAGGCRHLLYVSTTSVYGEHDNTITETSECTPVTDSAHANLAIEQHARQVFGQHATVLRLSGLVGDDRHPARYLSGREGLGNANQRVNLVHLDDVLTACVAIMERHAWGETLHLSAGQHPTRQAYYSEAAQHLGLPLPDFDTDENTQPYGKIIDATHTLEKLGLELAYDSPYDMLK